MDHRLIDEQLIPERYLMNQLSDSEAEAFEQHYLSCPDCLARVEIGERFARGMKRMAAQDIAAAAELMRAGWLARIARLGTAARFSIASVFLLVFALLPFLYIRNLNQQLTLLQAPQINTPILNLSPQRGAVPVSTGPSHQLRLPREPGWVMLALELDVVDRESYAAVLYDTGERPVWRAQGLRANTSDTLTVSLHSTILKAGDYTLALEGGSGMPRFFFRVVAQIK